MDFVVDVSRTCAKHGPYQAKRWSMPGGSVIEARCPACRDESVAEERASRDAAHEFRFRLALSGAGVGSRYYEASFDNYRVSRTEEASALATIRDYTERFSRGGSKNLIMYGNTGTGKTHLACAMTSALLRRGVSVAYLPILTMLTQYQDITSYGGEGTREEFFARLRAPDLLIIDEFGIVSLKDSERITLHRVIDERYTRKSPLVLIGNMSLSEMGKEVGERALRRIMGEATPIIFNWATSINGELFA